MMLTPLQPPSIHHNPSCDGCACDPEDNRMWKGVDSTKRRQGKTEHHLYISVR